MKYKILNVNLIIFQEIELMKIEHITNSRNSTNLSQIYQVSISFHENLSLSIIILCQENGVCFQGKTKGFLRSIGTLVVDWRGRIMFHSI